MELISHALLLPQSVQSETTTAEVSEVSSEIAWHGMNVIIMERLIDQQGWDGNDLRATFTANTPEAS